jgi:predicted CoA-binding protein
MSLGKDGHSDSEVKEILKLRNVAVVGISRDPTKPEILGVRCYASLLEVSGLIDIVDVFRRSQDVHDVLPVIEAASCGLAMFVRQLLKGRLMVSAEDRGIEF